jgi:hypothetical protein
MVTAPQRKHEDRLAEEGEHGDRLLLLNGSEQCSATGMVRKTR